jgi:hypothetical protein
VGHSVLKANFDTANHLSKWTRYLARKSGFAAFCKSVGVEGKIRDFFEGRPLDALPAARSLSDLSDAILQCQQNESARKQVLYAD